MQAPTATQLSSQASIKPPAADLLDQATNARHYAELLIERKFWMESIAYMSHAITLRESIWWAWFCARKAALPKADAKQLEALALAEAWIAQPSDSNRLAAQKRSQRIPTGAVQSVLMAIQYSGEMTDEATGEKLPAAPLVSHNFVYGAVLSACYEFNGDQPELAAAEFLKQSFDVANRIQLWAKYS